MTTPPSDFQDDALLKRARRAEDALRDLVDDLHKRATACTALMATAATVEDQTRLLNKHIGYEHSAALAHLALLSLRDSQS